MPCLQLPPAIAKKPARTAGYKAASFRSKRVSECPEIHRSVWKFSVYQPKGISAQFSKDNFYYSQ